MAILNRCKVTWTTGIGGSGLSVFYFPDTQTDMSALMALVNSWKPFMPPVVSWQVPSSGDQLNDASGLITGSWSGSGGGSATATGATTYVAGTGVLIRWTTGTVIGRRRLLGRTFVVPLTTGHFDTNGTILDATVTTLQTAATAFVAAVDSQVWHRPPKGQTSGGQSAPVNGSLVLDKVTSLRSRRT